MDYTTNLSVNLYKEKFSYEDVQKILRIVSAVSKSYEIKPRKKNNVNFDQTENQAIVKTFGGAKRLQGFSDKTIKAYTRELKLFSKFVSKPIVNITAQDISLYLDEMMARNCKNSTVETARACISSFCTWMYETDLVSKDPSLPVKPIKIKDEIRLPFSAVELERLRNSCTSEKTRAIVELLLSSGIRINEMSSLDIADVDFNSKTLHIRQGKGGKDRIVLFGSLAELYLKRYLATRKDSNQALFINNHYERLSSHGAEYLVRELGKTAGITKTHPHRFRRTFATTLSKRGMPIYKISKLLGHSDVSVTMRYIYMSDQDIANSYEKCS